MTRPTSPRPAARCSQRAATPSAIIRGPARRAGTRAVANGATYANLDLSGVMRALTSLRDAADADIAACAESARAVTAVLAGARGVVAAATPHAEPVP